MSFRDDSFYEEALETPVDVIWWTAKVSCKEQELFLDEFTLYSTTGARLELGYAIMRSVFRHIEAAAVAEGFRVLWLEASRIKRGKPRRTLSIRRVLV